MINLEAIKSKFLKERVSAGLDIGSSSLRLIKLRFLQETVELAACEEIPLRPDAPSAINELAQRHNLERVNIAVSGPAVVTRYAVFPKMQPQELSQSLKFEAQKHIPFEINDVYLDAAILKSDLGDNKMLVLVCAAKKEVINARLKLFEGLKVKVNLIDLDCLGIINAFLFNYSEEKESAKTFALLDIGSRTSSLSIVDESIPGLNRDIHFGADDITRKLQEELHLDPVQAEEVKINPGPMHAAGITAAIEYVVSSLADEIRTSFDYYESQNASTVGRIFLSGAGSNIAGFRDSLANVLGMQVDHWDPLRKIIFGGNFDTQELKSQSLKLAVAVGLALR
jgi:type IV pilus assembly protein PilM